VNAVNRNFRVAVVGASPCGQCVAACCKQNGHEYAALLQGDDERRRFAPWSIDVTFAADNGVRTTRRVLPYVSGRCPFLDESDRCRIYEDRPAACRAFQCVTSFNAHGPNRHGRFLRDNPDVLKLLRSL
jgi:Fe-S-cluster containining protein